jgi:hypothetical protein
VNGGPPRGRSQTLENPILITANFKVLKAAPPILGMRPRKRIGGKKIKHAFGSAKWFSLTNFPQDPEVGKRHSKA